MMDDTQRIALVRIGTAHPDDRGPAVQFHLGDHLGSSNVVVDSGGALVNREEFTPYGETSFGSFAKKRYRFTGMERDEESGLHFHNARYYLSWLLRWLSVDPYLVTPEKTVSPRDSSSSSHITKCIKDITTGKGEVISSTRMNPYCYSLDNPINLSDRNGAEPTREKVGEAKNIVNHVRQLEKDYAEEFKGKEPPPGLGISSEMFVRILVNKKVLEKFKEYATFNKPGERYIYTKRGGWVDMAHFARAAGEIGNSWWGDLPIVGFIGRGIAENKGFGVERDQVSSPKPGSRNSAFSYEDLPSNHLGFEFGRNIHLGQPLSTQLDQFFQGLQSTKPQNAPNWKDLPRKDSDTLTREPPRNLSDRPLFTFPPNGNQPSTPEQWRKQQEVLKLLP
jgi:RHS repeat-associated protein